MIMDRTLGVTEARGRFAEIIDRVRYQGDSVVLMKSGKPAAAIVPYPLFEQWKTEREELFAVVDEIQKQNRELDMSEEELVDFVNEIIYEMRSSEA
jgi:prevent-host-death family protein